MPATLRHELDIDVLSFRTTMQQTAQQQSTERCVPCAYVCQAPRIWRCGLRVLFAVVLGGGCLAVLVVGEGH